MTLTCFFFTTFLYIETFLVLCYLYTFNILYLQPPFRIFYYLKRGDPCLFILCPIIKVIFYLFNGVLQPAVEPIYWSMGCIDDSVALDESLM
jgi:hypothetical protein